DYQIVVCGVSQHSPDIVWSYLTHMLVLSRLGFSQIPSACGLLLLSVLCVACLLPGKAHSRIYVFLLVF
ncbi:Uncharacterized protein APZ42_000638, partial [Daphnia magna]